jgi:hypothetical protein
MTVIVKPPSVSLQLLVLVSLCCVVAPFTVTVTNAFAPGTSLGLGLGGLHRSNHKVSNRVVRVSNRVVRVSNRDSAVRVWGSSKSSGSGSKNSADNNSSQSESTTMPTPLSSSSSNRNRSNNNNNNSNSANNNSKKKTLGLITFDLDDTLYPIAPVIEEANRAFARSMESFGYGDNIRPQDIVDTGVQIREEMAVTDPDRAAVLTHTEIRQLAIRREMERITLSNKLKACADDWATPVSSLSPIVVQHAKKYVEDDLALSYLI